MTGALRRLELPEDLCAAAEQKFGQRFGTVEELLAYVLQDLLKDEASRFDQAEQSIVEERLRELGYI
jgi:hypothetical protein